MKRYRTKKVTAAAKKTTRIRKRPPKLWIPNSKTPDDLPSEVTTPQNKTNSDWEGVFFKPDEFQIFKDAHAIAEKLVFDVKRPYAKKLISLATYGIDRFNRFNTKEGEAYTGTAEEVISKAWNTVVFAWETKTSTAITEKRACAFAQTYEEDGKAKPLMAFSESFRLKNPQRGFLATQRGKLVATAFFFKKIKHEFLHIVHRYPYIVLRQTWEGVTPTKYTPSIRRQAEVGEHDEEEDTGGQVLPKQPFFAFRKGKYELYILFKNKYRILNNRQLRALLDLDLYETEVNDVPHNDSGWGVEQCRTLKRRSDVFSEKFYK
jgi:hypothetical protein